MVTAGIISVVIGGHFGGGDHFDGGDHFGGGTVPPSRISFKNELVIPPLLTYLKVCSPVG